MNTSQTQIRDIINTVKTAMLNTWDGRVMKSRPMETVQDEYTGTIYFLAPSNADPVKEMKSHPDVGVTYMHSEAGLYLSLSGKAEISNDTALKKSLWNDDVSTWFPKGAESDDVVVICIRVESGESWRSSDGFSKLYKRILANLESDNPDLSFHTKYSS